MVQQQQSLNNNKTQLITSETCSVRNILKEVPKIHKSLHLIWKSGKIRDEKEPQLISNNSNTNLWIQGILYLCLTCWYYCRIEINLRKNWNQVLFLLPCMLSFFQLFRFCPLLGLCWVSCCQQWFIIRWCPFGSSGELFLLVIF